MESIITETKKFCFIFLITRFQKHLFCRKDGFTMTMQAITKISKGEEITHAYTEPLDPVMTRKSILSLGKFFQVDLSLEWEY